jgi:hypothetical protein
VSGSEDKNQLTINEGVNVELKEVLLGLMRGESMNDTNRIREFC